MTGSRNSYSEKWHTNIFLMDVIFGLAWLGLEEEGLNNSKKGEEDRIDSDTLGLGLWSE